MLKMLIGLGLVLLVLFPPLSGAQEKADGQSLEQAANDPTASLMSSIIPFPTNGRSAPRK